jgi:hypothetical protein
MNTARSFFSTAAAIAALLGASSAFAQQTIDHNKALAGNVTPGDTPGYPITLSQPGHYKLMSNLVVPAETGGIVITAPNVTLDLNGFTISGPVTCSQNKTNRQVTCSQEASSQEAHAGICVQGSNTFGTKIRNGTVRGFRGIGLLLSDGDTVQNLRVTQNAHIGVTSKQDSEAGLSIADSMIDLNGSIGVVALIGLLERSRVASNGDNGIQGGTQFIVHDSLVRSNSGWGLYGVTVRGTATFANGGTRSGVTSLGGNIDLVGVF